MRFGHKQFSKLICFVARIIFNIVYSLLLIFLKFAVNAEKGLFDNQLEETQIIRKGNNNDLYDVSIIIPVYNSMNTLNLCLDSVCDQVSGYEEKIEVIVVDDGSTDGSAKIIERYSKRFGFKVIMQQNKGLSGARNSGISLASGRYLYFLDSDDYLLPKTIEEFLKWTQSDADCVQFSFQRINFQRQETGVDRFEDIPSHVTDVFEEQWSGYPWGKLFRRELWFPFGFAEGYWFEDTAIPALIWPRVEKYATSSFCAQAYVDNPSGITRSSAYSERSIEHIMILFQLFKEQDQLGIHRLGAASGFWREHISSKAYGRIRKMRPGFQKKVLHEIHILVALYPEILKPNKFTLRDRLLSVAIQKESLIGWTVCSLLG